MRVVSRIAIAAALAPPLCAAQPAPPPGVKVERIEVTASPLGRSESELAQPATVLGEEELRRKRGTSLGETLSQETGVQSSAFGPASGRPVIRGLDGPRIRVLENGIGTLDVSSVSPDHMVSTESLNAEQIEILRGPASLIYGSGAIGGIVNVVSNLVPRTMPERFTGSIEARGASANRERTAAANLNGGAGEVAWHLDAFRRRTDDYRIPVPAVRGQAGGAERLSDSAIDARGGGAGISLVNPRGHFGVGVSRLESIYGIPSGEGSHIDLAQTRYEGSAEWSDPVAGIERVRARIGRSRYQHHEIESSGEIATTFRNRATEGRLELRHRAIGALKGTVGVQVADQSLSAQGEEAVIPPARSRGIGIFVVEQAELGAWTFDAGVRGEREKRDPSVGEADAARFGAAVARRFSLFTPAAGVVWKFAGDYRLAVSATQAERAPSVEELFSNGPHAATATFDIGDPGLRKEVSRNVDITLRKARGELQWKVNLFVNRFRDYVHAVAVDGDGDGAADRVNDAGELDPEGELRVQRFTQGRARFRGVEGELGYRPASSSWGVRLFGDVVRARLDGGTYLPRIAPARLGASADLARGPWSASASALHAFSQKRAAPLETPTPGYTRVDGEVAFKVERKTRAATTIFLQATNLLDREIRLHTSHLKEVAPLTGRSFTLGVRGEF